MTHFGGSRDAGVRHMRLSMRCAHVRFSVFSWSNQLRTWKLSGDCSRWPVCAWALEHQIIRYNYLTSQSPRKVLYRIFWYILGVQECGQGLYDPLHCPLFLIEERPLKSNWMILKLTSLRTYGTIEVRHANVSKMRTCLQTSFRQQPVAGPVLDQSAFSEDQKEKVLDNFKLLDQSKSGKELKEFQFHIQSMCKFLVRRSLEPTAGADGMLRFFLVQ